MLNQLAVYIGDGLDPHENLALEFHLLRTTPEDCCTLYLWQNRNTVVIGRNQNVWAECRVSQLEADGGKLARRLSGGGAVYHDTGNLNFTFLCHGQNYDLDRQFRVIARACELAGIRVERSGRNDLLADGKKFSGNAFYSSQGRAYHHGTLLIHADMEKLSRYLTPPKAKLEAKGVTSVRSRVCNLSELVPGLDCEAMKKYMVQAFSEVYGMPPQPITLTDQDDQQIRLHQQEFSSHDFLYGTKLPAAFSCTRQFSWGNAHLEMNLLGGVISQVRFYTDAMDWSLSGQVENALQGRILCPEGLEEMFCELSDPQISNDLRTMLREQIL